MRLIGVLLCAGLCLAAPERTVRWCVVSDDEDTKCSSFSANMKTVLPEDGPSVSCVMKASYTECIKDISANKIDAVSIDGAFLVEADLPPLQDLKPIMAEYYGSKDDPKTYYYAVALVKKGTNFKLNKLKYMKSCHPGLGWSAGWYIPLSILLPSESLETEAATFFSGSCAPCADRKAFPSLCQLCAGNGEDKCACSSSEPYFGYSGAFKCLQDGAGDVSFVKHLTVFEVMPQKADRDQYELLCADNTRRPVDEYKQCYLAQVPSDVVLARSVNGKEDVIRELLGVAQDHFGNNESSVFELFGSPHGKDLLFTDAASGFLNITPKMDINMYLGNEHFYNIKSLKRGLNDSSLVRWCAVGFQEEVECTSWSFVNNGPITCAMKETPEDCIVAIMKGEADAMILDGTLAFIASHCGLIPILGENYLSTNDIERRVSECIVAPLEGYYAVAVVKKSDVDITWNSLRGKKSCHTAVGTSAGWIVPLDLIYNQTGSCKLDEFFNQSCVPGFYPNSSRLCDLCSGDDNSFYKCASSNHEKYYGPSGALRCLVEKGDVAFVKHSTVLQITDGKDTPDWAKDLKQEDFELLCLDGTRKPVTEAQSCHLAKVPNHAVFTRTDKKSVVTRMIFDLQDLFGRVESLATMFQYSMSGTMFSDGTECLSGISRPVYEEYVGPQYLTMMANLRQCLSSELLDACTFHRH
ncbi:inhibitor of carbonic anhydrase [Sigmodon hispidus]